MDSKKNIDKLHWENHEWPSDEHDDMFTPSEKVWEKVSKQLPIKKKKRPILLIIFFFVVSTASIYFWTDTQKSHGNGLHIEATKSLLKKKSEQIFFKSKLVTTEIHQSNYAASDPQTKVYSSNNKSILLNQSTTIHKSLIQSKDAHHSTNNTFLIRSIEKYVDLNNNEFQSQNILDEIHKKENTALPINVVSNLGNEIIQLTSIPTLKIRLKSPSKGMHGNRPKITVPNNQKDKWIFGLGMSVSPTSFKSPSLNDPLEGTIETSAYTKLFQLHSTINRSITQRLFVSITPGIRFDVLNTAYNLSIPYDYNTEVELNDKKENYFSHSLPTDLGNIKTRMVVVRATDSPVQHNEKINIGFDVKYKTLSLTSAIGIHYALKNEEKGIYIGARFVPQLVINRKTEVVNYESHHTYVKGDHVDISKDDNYRDLYFGSDIQLGYRMPFLKKNVFFDINAVYHKNLNSEGRPSDLDIGISLFKSF